MLDGWVDLPYRGTLVLGLAISDHHRLHGGLARQDPHELVIHIPDRLEDIPAELVNYCS